MTTYYVSFSDPGASDGNAGTDPVLPWKTRGKVNSTLLAGDTCLFKAGDSWASDGTEGAAGGIQRAVDTLTFGVYGAGAAPIMSPVTPSKSCFYLDGRTGWTIQDLALTNANQMVTLANTCNSVTIQRCSGYNLADHGIGTAGTAAGDGHIIQDNDIRYAANDSINTQGSVGATTPTIIRRNVIVRSGYLTDNSVSGIGGSGDAISCHGTCRMDAYDNVIMVCAKGGIIHVSTLLCRSYRNFISDCVSWGINHTAGTHWAAANTVVCRDTIVTISGSIPGCINFSGTCVAGVYGNTCYVKSATSVYGLANRGNASGTFRNNKVIRDGSGFFASVDLAGVGVVVFDYNSYQWDPVQTTVGEPSLFNATSNKTLANWKLTTLPGLGTPGANETLHPYDVRAVPVASAANAIPKSGAVSINFANGAVDAGQPDYNLDFYQRARGSLPWDAGSAEFAALTGAGLWIGSGGIRVSL